MLSNAVKAVNFWFAGNHSNRSLDASKSRASFVRRRSEQVLHSFIILGISSMEGMAANFSSSVPDGISEGPLEPRRTFQVVVAATSQLGIGKDGKLPWRLATDMKFFKEITCSTSGTSKKNAVIMGRKTWESLPKKNQPLPGRLNVVMSRSGSFEIATMETVVMCGSLASALEMLAAPPYSLSIETVFVIGGGQVYREALTEPNCDAIHSTEIENPFECDTFMPPIDTTVFRPWYSSFPSIENDVRFCFTTYVRIKNSSTTNAQVSSEKSENGSKHTNYQ